MQISLWRQLRNRPIPLTSSVVQQMMARFLTFTAYKKSRFSLKRCSAFQTGVKIYLSEKIFWCTLKRKPCTTNSPWCTFVAHDTELPMHSPTTLLAPPTQTWCYLPVDIAVSGASAIPSLLNFSGHSFLSGICCREPPTSYTAIDDERASVVSSSLNTLAITWDCIKVVTASDTNMVQLISIIESGFPEYQQFHDHLYTVDGVILFKSSTVIPPSPSTCPHHPSFDAPGRDLHDCMCRNDRLLARHNPSHHCRMGKLSSQQPHGALPI